MIGASHRCGACQASKLPVCLGFVVRDRVKARQAAAVADGVLIGTEDNSQTGIHLEINTAGHFLIV